MLLPHPLPYNQCDSNAAILTKHHSPIICSINRDLFGNCAQLQFLIFPQLHNQDTLVVSCFTAISGKSPIRARCGSTQLSLVAVATAKPSRIWSGRSPSSPSSASMDLTVSSCSRRPQRSAGQALRLQLTCVCEEVFRTHIQRLILCTGLIETKLRAALVAKRAAILALPVVLEVVHP